MKGLLRFNAQILEGLLVLTELLEIIYQVSKVVEFGEIIVLLNKSVI